MKKLDKEMAHPLIYLISYIFSCFLYSLFAKGRIHFYDVIYFALIFGILEFSNLIFIKRILLRLLFFIVNSLISNILILMYWNFKNFKFLKLISFSCRTAFSTWGISIFLSVVFSFFSLITILIFDLLKKRHNKN